MSTTKLKTVKTKRYGWKPDKPDFRDHRLTLTAPAPLTTVLLADKYAIPIVVDQGNLGSCTGNGIGGVVMFDLLNKHAQNPVVKGFNYPSRLFIYYNERVIEGSVKEDAGAEIRDGIKSIAQLGVCNESAWKYQIAKFAAKPPKAAYTAALKIKALEYKRLDNTKITDLVGCLQQGLPFVFGFTVYESFEGGNVAVNGMVPMPGKSESVLGGHCVYCIGYDAQKKVFVCVNSWGAGWANKGIFYMPEAYLTDNNLADDFWQVTTVL